MFCETIDKLKTKKKQLQNFSKTNKDNEKRSGFEITISKKDNIFKIEISDYISVRDYDLKMKKVDNYGLVNLIKTRVLWDSSRQMVNKGIYYVIVVNNRLYNILINDEILKIDERIRKEFDEEAQEKNITEEKVLTFDLVNNQYNYCSAKHDSTGDTYYIRYYNKYRLYSLGSLDLSEEEAYDELSSLIYNLENIEGIDSVLDLELLEKYLLKGSLQRKKIL